MIRRPRAQSDGFTLLEMLVVISAGSLVLGTAVAALGLLTQSHSVHREDTLFSTARFRLACQFRDDVRRATTWQLDDPDGFAWSSEGPEGVAIRYEVEDDAVIRVATKAGKVLARERYRQPYGTSITVRRVPSGKPTVPLIEMTLEVPSDLDPRTSHRIVAQASADGRYEGEP